jgi:hypothetical protein
MMHKNHQMENCKSAANYPSGKQAANQSVQKQPSRKAGYATYSYDKYLHTEFRAKSGFLLGTGVLPTKPVQTASAATPLPPRRPAATSRPVEIPEPAPTQSIPEPPTSGSPDIPQAHPQERQFHRASASADVSDQYRPLSLMRRKRAKRHLMPLQSGLLAGIFTAFFTIAFGAFWWLETPTDTMLVKAAPSPSAQYRAAETRTPRQSPSGTPPRQQSHAANAVVETQTSNSGKETGPNEIHAQPELPRRMPKPEPGSSPDADTRIASAAKSRRETADLSTAATRKKQARDEKNRRAARRTVTATGNDRAEEINRLRTQAFSETKKDRVGTAKPSRKSSTPDRRFNQASARQTPGNPIRLAKQTSTETEFNQCKRNPGFLQQEKCKWQVCAGKWGKNGCPAYNHDVARY